MTTVLTPLAKAIRAAGLTQRELANRIGVHEATLSRYVHGLAVPDEHLTPLADALGITPSALSAEADAAGVSGS